MLDAEVKGKLRKFGYGEASWPWSQRSLCGNLRLAEQLDMYAFSAFVLELIFGNNPGMPVDSQFWNFWKTSLGVELSAWKVEMAPN